MADFPEVTAFQDYCLRHWEPLPIEWDITVVGNFPSVGFAVAYTKPIPAREEDARG